MKTNFAASKIRAVQIRAMENRASQGMPVVGTKPIYVLTYLSS